MLFAVCAPGLEPVLLSEVRALGLPGRAETGGVLLDDDAAVERLNLWLRTASRVLVRIGEFKATAFPELVRKAAALPWEKHLARGARVAFHVTCRKSRLYHSGAVRERLQTALQERLGREVTVAAAEDDGQLFVARI
jgi:putative N6-adenine-specific DNA methylase